MMQASQSEKNYKETLKTAQLIETVNLMRSTINRGVSDYQDSIIGGGSTTKDDYDTTRSKIDKAYQNLSVLTTHSPSQIKRLRLLGEKIAGLSRLFLWQQKKDSYPSNQSVHAKAVQLLSSEIEGILDLMVKEEKLTLLKHNNHFKKLNRRIQITTIAGSYLLLLVIISSLIIIIQNREQILKLFRQVDEKNKQLEAQKNELQDLTRGLVKQNYELERIAYIASHDLRSPGVNLAALLQLYESAKQESDRMELIRAIKQVSDNLLAKLDDLIEMLRSKDAVSTAKEVLEFEAIYTKLLKMMAGDIKRTHALIEHDFSAAPTILYPKSYLESIMQNLITNAIKFRHPERPLHIHIFTFKKEGKTYLWVKDNGLGIDLGKYGDKLFGIYQTFHNRTDSKGIGLYITKAQIVAMGGQIEAESTPGEGTTFKVCFN